MRFSLVDRITDLQPGKEITVLKNLTMAEEYLAEHFAGFPVMPGVLMVETISQAGAWLVRLSENFRHSMVVLQEARNVRFGRFVTPGNQLVLRCQWVKESEDTTTIKATGTLDGVTSVTAKATLRRFNLTDRDDMYQAQDRRLNEHFRRMFDVLAAPDVRRSLMAAS